MDVDLQGIEQRLAALFDEDHRLVFWEDPQGEYTEAVNELQLSDAQLVDATSHELATKRLVLRERPTERFVIYRSGPTPQRESDFLYDLKCMAPAFSCKREAIWAEECGIDRRYQDVLAEHGFFFAEKGRRDKLATIQMPKDGERAICMAMIAASANLPATTNNERDALRDTVAKLLVEYAEGEDERTDRKHPTVRALLQKSNLEDAFWDAVERIFGYRAPQDEAPGIADLALRMLITDCASVMPEGEEPLSSDAVRVLNDLRQGSESQRTAYAKLITKKSKDVEALVPAEKRTPEALLDAATLPAFDEWTLMELARQAGEGALSTEQMRTIIQGRREGFWYKEYLWYYEALDAAADFFEQEQRFREGFSSALGAKELFDVYCSQWFAIDRDYRRFCLAWHNLPNGGSFKEEMAKTRQLLLNSYDRYLSDLAERWQRPLKEGDTYPPANVPCQREFFVNEVLIRTHEPEDGKRVGVIISDALRYEVGADLVARLNVSNANGLNGRVRAECTGMLSMLPSYTQLGMAALLPEGSMEIDPDDLTVSKGGEPTQGLANRQAALERRLPGSCALKAADVLQDGLPDVSGAPVIYVYHDAIDARGDDAGTQTQVFAACEDALDELEQLASQLVRAGCGTVLITADHGFIYQDAPVPESQFVDVPGLHELTATTNVDVTHKDRFIVGDCAPKHESLIECTPARLSLDGEGSIVFPCGISRLRQRGSGKQYVHGGDTLQECAIPLVRVRVVGRKEAARPVGVAGYPVGQTYITGTTVTLDVYQQEPCSDHVTPSTVKVGVYAPDNAEKGPGKRLSVAEERLELDSREQSTEARRKRVRLHLTDDVDEYATVTVRILARKSDTNQYGCAWECEYTVRRGFGGDFF